MNQQSLFNSFKSAVALIAMLFGVLLIVQPAHAFEGDLGGNQYNAYEARSYQRVRVGVVEDIREVVVNRESNSAAYVGSGIGATIGGILGATAGRGKGRLIATALAGTVGGLIGKTAGDYVGREQKHSAEIVVSMSDGNVFSVVQEIDGETAQIRPGDRVRLIEGQAVRVVKLRSNAF